jgi:hypothetical protein
MALKLFKNKSVSQAQWLISIIPPTQKAKNWGRRGRPQIGRALLASTGTGKHTKKKSVM